MLSIISKKQLTRVPLQLNGWKRYDNLFKVDMNMYKEMIEGDITPLGSNFLHSLMNTYGGIGHTSPFEYSYNATESIKASTPSSFANRTVIKNLFYNTDVSLYINTKATVNLGNWRDMEPLRIVSMQESEIVYFDFSTEQVSDERVYAELNTTQLFYMYALYKGDHKDGYSIAHFLTSYLFPNVFKSFINNCIWNTLAGNIKDNNIMRLETPIPLHIESDDIEKIYKKHLELLGDRKESIGFYLKSLPLIGTNALTFVGSLDGQLESYRTVFEFVSKISFTLDIWRMIPESAHDINMHYIYDLVEEIRQLKGHGLLKSSPHLTDHVEDIFRAIKEISK